jgi:hypothetical protein
VIRSLRRAHRWLTTALALLLPLLLLAALAARHRWPRMAPASLPSIDDGGASR